MSKGIIIIIMNENQHNAKEVEVEVTYKGKDGKIFWMALISTGHPIFHDDQWLISKDRCHLFNGYRSVRMVKGGNGVEYKIEN